MTIAEKSYCYFHFKVGGGNRFLELATDPRGDEGALLYVGFSDVVERGEGDDFDPREHIALRPSEPVYDARANSDRKRLDENYIAWLLDDANRDWVRLLVFSDHELHVFRARESRLLCVSPERNRSVYERALRLSGDAGSEVPKIFKFIKAERVGEPLLRSSLYTAIDSLRTYQFLNQGTCRPVWRASGPGDRLWSEALVNYLEIPDALRFSLAPEERIRVWHSHSYDSYIHKEQPFGNFIRRYLNERLGGDDPATLTSLQKSLRTATDERDRHRFWQTLAFSTLNPILTETAAFYFCLDVGFNRANGHRGLIPDVGVGKGIDTIDLRARVFSNESGMAETRALVRDRLKPLVELADGSSLDDLIENDVLEIQCKASSSRKSKDRTVYFGPDGGAQGNRILMQNVFETVNKYPSEWPLLNSFMQIQVRTIQNRNGH
jgi:hypothetical protein